jgi:pyruvate kinase
MATHREPLGKVRTKIVATVGPASSDPTILRALVQAGVDVFRLNFSHGTHEEHTEQLRAIREISQETGITLAVLQDLCGPKIRLGEIPGGMVACDHDAVFVLSSELGPSDDPHHLTCTYPSLPDQVKVGQNILFADGTVVMEVIACEAGRVQLKVTLPGLIRSSQGINVPGSALGVRALTDKDLADLEWPGAQDIDYVGLSFVRRAEDIIDLRQELERRGSQARIVAKIEKREALANLEAIIAESDAVMIARGDLGVELDVTRVPAVQKQIISACHDARVPVITATQMLNSMETSSRPTRAEASDVFNAVLDGTDAVMLSGETAIGHYPVEAVATMSRILIEAESLLFAQMNTRWRGIGSNSWGIGVEGQWPRPLGSSTVARAGQVRPITESVVEAASLISRRLNVALLVAATHSGRTALALSKQRNPAPTLALAYDAHTARAMALYWGVTALTLPDLADPDQSRVLIEDWCRARGLIATGDRVLVVHGSSPDDPGHNRIVVREIC